MAEVSQKASENWAKKKMKATALELAVQDRLDSPRRRPQTDPGTRQEKDPVAERAGLLARIKSDLHAPAFAEYFKGLTLAVQHKVTLAEAQEHGIGAACRLLVKGAASLPAKTLGQKLLDGWVQDSLREKKSASRN